MKLVQTLTGKDIIRAGLVEVVGSFAASPPVQEEIHGDDNDSDASNTTNNATNNSADRSRLYGYDGCS